jgi:hypothetical protein
MEGFELPLACPYQKLNWQPASEVNGTSSLLRPGSNLGSRASFHRKLDFDSKRAHKARCILAQALGTLCRSGSFARVKMLQAADLSDLDNLAKRGRLDRSTRSERQPNRCQVVFQVSSLVS